MGHLRSRGRGWSSRQGNQTRFILEALLGEVAQRVPSSVGPPWACGSLSRSLGSLVCRMNGQRSRGAPGRGRRWLFPGEGRESVCPLPLCPPLFVSCLPPQCEGQDRSDNSPASTLPPSSLSSKQNCCFQGQKREKARLWTEPSRFAFATFISGNTLSTLSYLYKKRRISQEAQSERPLWNRFRRD